MKEEFIKNAPLFAELSAAEQRTLGKRMRLEKYSPNEAIFVTGGESDALYLIREGWVKLSSTEDGPAVANLGPGSLIGESDFFTGQLRTTTARASGALTVWSLTNDDLNNIIAEQPQLGLNLGLAFGKGIVQYLPVLREQLATLPLLKELSDRERALIARQLAPQRYRSNDAIYRSGDQPTGLYLIQEGTVRLIGDTDNDYAEIMNGEVFGEMAVIANKPHANTAQAAGEVVLWQLSPVDFQQLAESYPSIKTNLSRNLRATLSLADQEYAISVLKQIGLFEDVSDEA
ncbi:MAG: cyclic nucleotide-binding domain-containing protein, partial [Anaerolineae bacterium]|nr:cyclic nucleotide-binding domain-containing protein [Anaerolineae bacterium]